MVKKNGIFFGGGAGFFSYYLGISKYILENYDLKNVEFAGVSAGTIASICLCIEDPNFIDKILNEGLNDMRNNNTHSGTMFKDGVIGPEGIQILKSNLIKVIQESNKFTVIKDKCTIIATRLDGINPITEYIKDWNSINELVDCITASCWVPLVFGNISTKFRGSNYIDGGFPFLFNTDTLKDDEHEWIEINLYSFKRFHENPIQSAVNLGALFFSANNDFASHLIDSGYEDAKNNSHVFDKLPKKIREL